MIYNVRHSNTIRYSGFVHLAQFNVRLRPAPWPGQQVSNYRRFVDPLPWTVQEEEGAYVVNEARLTLRDPIMQLTIESSFTVDVAPPPADYAAAPSPTIAELRAAALARPDLTRSGPASYLFASPIAGPVPEIAHWAHDFIDEDMPVIAGGSALMAAIHSGFAYDSGATRADTPVLDAFRERHGVCQDFAHVMIVAARSHGIPAAYVSGYLRTLPPPGMQRLVGADAMHAWAALWCGEDLGWVGFDPTNDVFAGTDHIFVAMGRDYSDVAPLDGVFRGGGQQTMTFSVDVAPAE
ncbi:MAG: transglutaminase family protein [Sphingomonadales bacterium]|nr:transglutaminase family protein [Sphingomonadales bacterium]